MNRSGSTLLASLLDQYAEIGVSLEANIPDGIAHVPFELNKIEDIDRYLKTLYSDIKFRAWNIDQKILKERISSLTFPVGFPSLLQTVFKEYFKDTHPETYIYKCSYFKHMKVARKKFPHEKFIFLMRDVRAIYNSQKKSIDSVAGAPMSNNPVTTALSFKKVSSMLDRYIEDNNFYVLKYEDLVSNTDYELERILNFINVNSDKKDEFQDYWNKIASEQKHLHQNVMLLPIEERIHAWRDELSKQEIIALQYIAKDKLVKYGYDIVRVEIPPMLDWLSYKWFWMKHYLRIFRKTRIALKVLLCSPSYFRKGHFRIIAPNVSRSVYLALAYLKNSRIMKAMKRD